jgi:hypothetical protein
VRTTFTSGAADRGGRVEDPHGAEEKNAQRVLFLHAVQSLHAAAGSQTGINVISGI